MMVGVNGTGKTTSAGKLAAYFVAQGRSVLLCAADTFRAAAIEQLEVWAARCNVPILKTKTGGDPSAALFDACTAARARGSDVLIVDTAGRLHTKTDLMKELDKMRRTAERLVPGAPHQTLLVMDATTGQNGLQQARLFTEAARVTGIVLTKLDGTAKGGIVLAIATRAWPAGQVRRRWRKDGRPAALRQRRLRRLDGEVEAGARYKVRWYEVSGEGTTRRSDARSMSGSCSSALQLARASLGLASPNPQVGCVVVQRRARSSARARTSMTNETTRRSLRCKTRANAAPISPARLRMSLWSRAATTAAPAHAPMR